MKTKGLVNFFLLIVIVVALPTVAVIAKGPPTKGEETANNLSFPAIAVDGFAITQLMTPSFTVPYTGTYPGLTTDEIAALVAAGPWYPQKTEGNLWQADFVSVAEEDVTYIDWGDNIESVSPTVRIPFRLEVTLYKLLAEPMTAYTMAVLEYPSSSTELQGTNTTTYNNPYATVVSGKPKMVVQYLGSSVPMDLAWDAASGRWTSATTTLTLVQVSFAPELNVGGKYVYGASQGGWKPTSMGWYRLTFYIPATSGVNLALATIANASDGFSGAIEGTKAVPKLDEANNLTYVDVLVVGGKKP